ncbi:hypothetical protein EW026_g4082 [Hermanssonia centrifuga]|uniref:T-cell immunomodulatory protein TIP C2 domain-containing protein n=1 Tax=Hermanssonia centrifuga TaxID=98765 RepID=A0A4S4KIA5_9APHY|nr:hypothetical protein EW026_g4082 [Hermanssonia centrifuga]
MNGDLQIDLFGTVPSRSSDTTFKVWNNIWNSSETGSAVFNLTDPNMDGAQCKLSNPHSNAAVDLNGDCLAVCDEENSSNQYFQIWVNNKDSGFSLAQLGRLPKGFQSITFGDIDRDGTIDMLFVTCDSVSKLTGAGSKCKINIAYNKQLPLCASATAPSVRKGKRVCRSPDDLCTADPDFQFDLHESDDNPDFVSIPLSDIFISESAVQSQSLLVLDTTQKPPVPIPIKARDRKVHVPHNSHIPYLAARGTLDIMVQRTGNQGEGNILFVQNNFYYDAFFLKAIVLNGACGSGLCSTPNGTKYHPFGVSYSGATYKYTVLDTSGRRSAAAVGQLPQTSYQSLLTPYSYFGLGRTNNYIENLFVGSTKHTDEHYIDMEGVIPNSKVVIIPPIDGDGPWKKELFLRPGEWIPWVTLTVVIATVILAIIVFVLHLNEKREDEMERRRASHHINFDAL